ncbi:hypothetical protein ACJO1Z_06665 [Vibrio parahaemolyticus]|uniref:hypothetical protein n=1 Tax=Vibrio harveyi group TaxID=717610 RepID=UPI0004A2BA9F|nr:MULTISPECIES: hypothetical protein [Vibrio harveyi group]EGR2714762.1 hypothetical protein [Vibrio parahaemolyticus]EHK7588875.1 hypothetical protein [Vibrio parahaemolyticus]EJG1805381.1 hypothetical protein [Vibrio parahaemolyticus]EJG1894542.1 hypothetical protein [Vibrio parahaemolyticus]ELB2166414.1 hypothetical protein [Vibrio parahaemolyticus]
MTDKLDILARLDAMSDDELFERLTSSTDYGLAEVLGTPDEFLGRNSFKHTYNYDAHKSLSFSVAKNQTHTTRMYHNINRIKEACVSRLDLLNEQQLLCA